MLTLSAIIFFTLVLLLGLLLEPVADRWRIPRSIVFILLGFVASEVVTKWWGIDTGIRWYNFKVVIFYGLLPVIVFHAALNADLARWRRCLLPILLLSIPLLLVVVLVTAGGIYLGIGHSSGFPWSVAFLCAVLVSATDPGPVLAVLKRHDAPAVAVTLLEGESLVSDAMAIVLFMLVLELAVNGSAAAGWPALSLEFLRVFLGGLLTGAVCGGIAVVLARVCPHAHTLTLLSLVAAYGTYFLSDRVFAVSGVMAVLVAGILMSRTLPVTAERAVFAHTFWDFLAHLTDALIFLMAGVTITLGMFSSQWLAMVIGIGAVLLARSVIIHGLLAPLSLLPGMPGLPWRAQLLLNWGGVRGGVTLALALSLPLVVDAWYTVQSIAYGVVLFGLFAQTTSAGWLLRKTSA